MRSIVTEKAFPGPAAYPSARLSILVLTAVTIACLVPFIGRAYNIDEPLFIWSAQHIRGHPFDPYGFQVNWYGSPSMMSDVTKNPPLACYYLAAASLITGWRETGVHLFFLVPAIAAVLGTYRLARRMGANGLLAGLASLLTPAFLVSGTTVMCDVTMVAFWVWALALWKEGLDEDKRGKLAISALLVAAAALTKYYGMALIPMLILYALIRKRHLGWWSACSLIPVALLAVYQYATGAAYGHGLLLDASAYVTTSRPAFTSMPAELVTGLTFAGGCIITLLVYAPLLWSRRELLIGAAVACVLTIVLVKARWIGLFPLIDPAGGLREWTIAQVVVYTTAGLSMIALAVTDVAKRHDADSALLLVWILGTLIFASIINWTVNARSILPAVPAVGILIVRRIESRGKLYSRRAWWWAVAPLIPAAALSIWVACADYALAGASRSAAAIAAAECKKSGGSLYSMGHWGLQYYVHLYGGAEFNLDTLNAQAGSVVAIAADNTNVPSLPDIAFVPLKVIEVNTPWRMSTMMPHGAGFYSDVFGPLPFIIGDVAPVRVSVLFTPTSLELVDHRITFGPTAKRISLSTSEHRVAAFQALSQRDYAQAIDLLSIVPARVPIRRNGPQRSGQDTLPGG